MRKSISWLSFLLFFTFTPQVFAYSVATSKIKSLQITGGGDLLVLLTNASLLGVTCRDQTPPRAALPKSDPAYDQMYGLILSSFMSGKSVTLYYQGCYGEHTEIVSVAAIN